MTDLTEQWKKGELPSGWYFVKGSRAEGIYSYTAEYLNNTYRPGNSERIIEQVPSYEEWQAKLNENAQLKTEYEKECHRADELEDSYWKAEKENRKLKEYERIVASYYMKPIDYETACETVNKLLDEKKAFKEENTKLKELLGECIIYVDRYVAFSVVQGNEEREVKSKELLAKIDEALK